MKQIYVILPSMESKEKEIAPKNQVYELTWEQVLKVHLTRRGVFADSKGVSSIVFSTAGKHGDDVSGQVISYVIPDRTNYRRDKLALIQAYERKSEFVVFQKIAVNRYRNLGRHVVQSFRQASRGTVFEINPAPAEGAPP